LQRIGATPIQWIRRIRAITTPEAQANGVTGEVVFRATFTAEGKISDVELISTVPYMAQAAEEALRKCTFRPATYKGVPITVRNVIVRIKVGTGAS
jgi:TonB family protein